MKQNPAMIRPWLLACLFTFILAAGTVAATGITSGRRPQKQMHTNRLIHEQSPYLLQHAHQPVDWYPWGEEALALARKEDRPIFLSIGYSTCHWCHVMAHESFEDPEIAGLLNRWFVCIKVDREERPDIDQVYMAAVQALNGSGGWPLSVFLFPDGRPFWGATYIPPRGQQGRPGFTDILRAVHRAWQGRRDELERTAAQLIRAIDVESGPETGKIEDDVQQKAFASLQQMFDAGQGGFGQAPKFPRPVVLDFLLRYWLRTGDERGLHMTLATLDAMARGGIRDHLGGGFHRYAVDRAWRVPHFEKMLYDQAQLASAYLDALLITADNRYGDVAAEIFHYVQARLQDPGGGFYSAEDADSDDPYHAGGHGEGLYYLWTEEDIVRTLGAKRAELFNYCYGVRFDGNVPVDPRQEFKGRNILYRRHTDREAAARFAVDEVTLGRELEQARAKLLARREERVRPHLDDKVITAWNGLMIGALARGGAILRRPDLVESAARAADFIQAHLFDPEKGTLLRRYRAGNAGVAGQLDDYAFLVSGLLELYRVQQEPELLQRAVLLTRSMIRLFRDRGRFFDSVAADGVPLRLSADYDGAEPAPNSVAAMNLLRLADLTGNQEWRTMALATVESFSSRLNSHPAALVAMLCALDRSGGKPRQVVIAGHRGSADTRELMATVFTVYDPDLVLLLADGAENQELLSRGLPFLKGVHMEGNRATAHVCENFSCRLPVTDAAALRRQLVRREPAAAAN